MLKINAAIAEVRGARNSDPSNKIDQNLFLNEVDKVPERKFQPFEVILSVGIAG